jgi:hypothetical protein
MHCPICSAPHDYHSCSLYVTASQNLKDFLKACWDQQALRPQEPQWATNPDHLYDVVYGPGEVREGEDFWTDIVGNQFRIRERIYLSVTLLGYDPVWDKFALAQHKSNKRDVPFVKRCNRSLVLTRPDNIVVYVSGVDVRDRLIADLRAMCREQPGTPGGGPPIPARLPRTCLRDAQVPATTRVSDLRGVCYATDPGNSISHGQQLCRSVAEAFKDPQKDFATFLGHALGVLRRKGVNLAQPSNPLLRPRGSY